jgi:hypothetical protein
MELPQIPRALRQRPRWRDLPIPFATFVGSDNEPDFKVVDETKRLLCIERNLCGLCGEPLKKPIVFIGGVNCCECRTFFDPGMHEECAIYAVKVCPYLANSDAKYSKRDPKHLGEDQVVIKTYEEISAVRPDKMALYYTNGFRGVTGQGPALFILADYPTKIDWDTIPGKPSAQ